MELTVSALTKSFGDKAVLKGVGFSAKSGRALGLLGRNGAGKTTTIRIIMDVFKADSGQVRLNGAPLSSSGVSIGYLPEERGLYPKRGIGEQMSYFGVLRGFSRARAAQAAKAWLDRVGLSDSYAKKLETLSKGNQQKVQLAVALMNDPDIVILDEPFSGLDPVNAMLLKEIVLEQVDKGKIVLFSSHQMGYVEEFCEDIALLNGGSIVLTGSLAQIKRAYPRDSLLFSSGAATAGDASRLIERMQGVIKSVSEAKNGCVLHLARPDDRGAVLKALSDMGAAVERYEVVEPTLEQIFVEKAGEGA